MVQLKETVVLPPFVERFRLASPPRAQICMNSFTDAPRNWEFDLMVMVTYIEMGLSADRITL